ncbi:MAG: hypothetical protein ICV62_03925 [Cyanobacteria bacterium Co-bin13]|nr:hypothetical protein [Cyanobacteria bacterium Co-bin13]
MPRKPWTEEQWLFLAIPISAVSIAASIAPGTVLAALGPIERAMLLLVLAVLAGTSIIGAMTDELPGE